MFHQRSRTRNWFFSSPKRPDLLCGPPTLLSNGYLHGVDRPGSVVNSPPISAVVKNKCNYNSPPLRAITALTRALPSRGQLKCDGTRAETRFRLSPKRTSPFKSAGGVSSVDYWQPRCAHQLLLLVVMPDTRCSEVVWRVLATHYIRQLPLHFPSRASPCAITFQLESTTTATRITVTQAWTWPAELRQ